MADWLTQRGYTAYVLAYRLPSEGWNAGNIVALQDAQPEMADMRTVVIVGSSLTRVIAREGRPWVYTPRSAPREEGA